MKININPKNAVRAILFQSKWILTLFYLGLIVAQVLYALKFMQEIWHLVEHFPAITENELMLSVLMLVDITMIANLLKMIITGSYQTFIEKIADSSSEKISSGALKIKMGGSLVGVSSIHLLQVFIDSSNLSEKEIYVKIAIHMVFLVSTLGLAIIDFLHVKSDKLLHDIENSH